MKRKNTPRMQSDSIYVDRVANLLRDSSVEIFYALFEEANLWGKNLYDNLPNIYMNKAQYTFMFISEQYAKKLWPTHEHQKMQDRALQESQEYILPARFDNTVMLGIPTTVAYISLVGRTPEKFVEIIHKKLINSGWTVPSESMRKALFSTATIPRVDSKTARISVMSTTGAAIPVAIAVAIVDHDTSKAGKTDSSGIDILTIPTSPRIAACKEDSYAPQ